MNGTSTFLQACENLCGGLFFYVEGSDEYENVEWLVGPDLLSDASKIPTKEQVLAEVARIKNQEIYKLQRSGQIFDGDATTDGIYPSIGDQLDLLWHDIDDGKLGDTAKTTSFYTTLKNVKAKYPKPSS